MRSFFTAALAAISLAAAPTASLAAGSGDASPLSIAHSPRAGAQLRDANNLGTTGLIIAGVALVGVVILFIVLIDDNNDNPSSP